MIRLLFVFLFLSFFCWPIWADELESLREENRLLKERVEKLEHAFQQIQNQIPAASTQEKPETSSKTVLREENAEILSRLDKVEKETTSLLSFKFLKGKLEISLYGYVKLDMIYDTARTNNGDTSIWVESEEPCGTDDQFNMTVNQTRFGFDIKAPVWEGVETTGKIEMDFYGGGNDNVPHPRMREAYLKIFVPDWDFSVLAGQTWDVIGPWNPKTINFLVLNACGNLGYRRPQLRLTKGFMLDKEIRFSWEAALTQTFGHTNTTFPDYLDSGEDSGFPSIQTRVAICLPLWTEKKATLGFGGHYGKEEYDLDHEGTHDHYDSWSLILDLHLPICDKVSLKGEIWVGKDLDSYMGGILQGINVAREKAVQSRGGWVCLELGPFGKWSFSTGVGIDDPERDDLSAGNRNRNWSVFTNFYYSMTDYLSFGSEFSYWQTAYVEKEGGENFRFQGTMMLTF